MSKMPKWMEDELKAIEREGLIREHGEEKAAEILLDRELGNLTYVYEEDENKSFLGSDLRF